MSNPRSSLPADFPRPSKHVLDLDPLDPTSCRECGDVNGLHIDPQPALDRDVPQHPIGCPDCFHQAHEGECRIARTPTSDVACGCRAAA